MATFDAEGRRRIADEANRVARGGRRENGGIHTHYYAESLGGPCGHRHRTWDAAELCLQRQVGKRAAAEGASGCVREVQYTP